MSSFHLGIVIPLKSEKVSKSWDTVSNAVIRTVRSIINQNISGYSFVVVGHERPSGLTDELLGLTGHFMTLSEFSPPIHTEDGAEMQLRYEFDRCSKIAKGIKFLSESAEVTHFFALDADDLLRDDFVETLSKYSDYDGILINRGYFYFEKFSIFNETDEFDAYCGSCLILKSTFVGIPNEIDKNAYRKTFFGRVSHPHYFKQLEEEGANVVALKERVMCYVRDNGENISKFYLDGFVKLFKHRLKMLLRSKRLGDSFVARFGIHVNKHR